LAVSEAELKQLYVDFKTTDKDKSGALDLKEFQTLMKKYLTVRCIFSRTPDLKSSIQKIAHIILTTI
jgi:Ca2+-binding EF-hand superfamily protein